MKNFEFHRPQKLDEAVKIFGKYNGKARIYAGGTDLLVRLRDRTLQVEALIDLKGIPHLDVIAYAKKTGLRLGTLARIRDIETSKTIRENFPILIEAAETLGSIQVRNKATVGGNLCNASPSADMAPPLIALGAEVKIAGKGKEKTMPLENFFKGPGKTALKNGEVLIGITIPNMAPRSCGLYLKQGRRKALDLAVAGVATVLTLDPTLGKCADVKIALGAVAPIPMRAKKTEAVIRGSDLSASVLDEAAGIAALECAPISDVRASEWYRREVVGGLVKRSIQQAIKKLTARIE